MKLKKTVRLIAVLSLALVISACGAKDNEKENSEATLTEDSDYGEDPEVQDTEDMPTAASDTDVDVDLSVMSGTMVYSEVFNMMVDPDSYEGKTVKMRGTYVEYLDESTGKKYYACVIMDATACCSQGIEFELTDDYTYPDDYPTVDDEICVSGTFETYMEGEYKYCTLKNAQLET